MPADPCEDKDGQIPDHLMVGGTLYDVDEVTPVDHDDGSTLLEVWATERGEGDGQSQ